LRVLVPTVRAATLWSPHHLANCWSLRLGELDPGIVSVLFRNVGEIDDQSGRERVPRQNVPTSALHNGRGGGEVVQDALKLRLDLLPATPSGTAAGLAGELEEVAALVVVQMKDARERLQHGSGCLHTALLESGVGVGADRGERGDLLTAQSGDPAGPPVSGSPTVRGLSSERRFLRNSPSSLRVAFSVMVPSMALIVIR